MIIHQGLLYRRIKSEDGRHRLQLVPPKALIQRTLQSLHSRTAERHHGRLRTLLRILEVAWWPAVRKDAWRYVGSCGMCTIISQSKEPPLHPAPTPTIKPGRRNLRRERRAGSAGYRKHQGGTVQPPQGYPGWYRLPPLCSGPGPKNLFAAVGTKISHGASYRKQRSLSRSGSERKRAGGRLENAGIDPATSRMLSERSTI
ncbi:XPA C and rve domain containing [Labeo rohita]|nr:XPA C and rve domain containing [Labeo rohita]RXN18788.1 XPA C and rve domain containing [Labeo rohita]